MTTSTNEMWQSAVNDATEAPHRALAAGRPMSAALMLRASLGRRVGDTHERALRQAKELVELAQSLAVALERDGLGSEVAGNNFAAQARTVSGALIRFREAREMFQSMESFRAAERSAVARAPRSEAPEPTIEAEGADETED